MTESVLVRGIDPVVVVSSSEAETVVAQPLQSVVQVTAHSADTVLISQQQGPAGTPGPQGEMGPQGPQGPQGPVGDGTVLGGYNLNLSGPISGDLLGFNSNTWVNVKPDTVTDGGNF